MVDFREYDSFELLVEEIQDQNEGTIFEYERFAFQNHQEYIEFLMDADETFDDSYIGRVGRYNDVRNLFSPVGLTDSELQDKIADEMEYDTFFEAFCENPTEVFHVMVQLDELSSALADAETELTYIDGIEFAYDIYKFRANRLSELSNGSLDDELERPILDVFDETDEVSQDASESEIVISHLLGDSYWPKLASDIATVYEFPEMSDEEIVEEIEAAIAEENEKIAETLERFESVAPSVNWEETPISIDSRIQTLFELLSDGVFEDSSWADINDTDSGVQVAQAKSLASQEADELETIWKTYEYRDITEPEVGDYLIFAYKSIAGQPNEVTPAEFSNTFVDESEAASKFGMELLLFNDSDQNLANVDMSTVTEYLATQIFDKVEWLVTDNEITLSSLNTAVTDVLEDRRKGVAELLVQLYYNEQQNRSNNTEPIQLNETKDVVTEVVSSIEQSVRTVADDSNLNFTQVDDYVIDILTDEVTDDVHSVLQSESPVVNYTSIKEPTEKFNLENEVSEKQKVPTYKVAVKVTGKEVEERNGIEYPTLTYDVLEYPEEEIEARESPHPIVELEENIQPLAQDSFIKKTSKESAEEDVYENEEETFDES